MKFVVLVFAGLLSWSETAKLPKSWITCKMNDPKHNECMKRAFQGTVPLLVKGIPSLGIRSIDPLHFDKVAVNRGNGPIKVDLEFKNIDVAGLTNATVTKVSNDWKKMIVEVKAPHVTVKGKYSLNGTVLILPINGNGDCELKMNNFETVATIDIKQVNIKGKPYYTITNFDVKMSCDPLKLKFDNLFNGNKQLGDQMNVFLNQNWKEIFVEVKPSIEKALGMSYKQMGNNLFSKVPVSEITKA